VEEKFNILLIEDNPADARLIDIYLGEAFDDSIYTLTTAYNLQVGLEFIPVKEFAIILVDLTLPDSSGLDTFKKVFEKAPDTPIIVLTGVEDERIGLNAMKLGAQDFLIKGKVKGKGLRRSINYAIERNKLTRELSEKTKKLEEKTADLLKEKIKLSEAQKLAHIGSWEWNIEKGVVTCSEEFYDIYGLSHDETKITYENLLKHVHNEDRKLVKDTIEGSYVKQVPFNFYHRIVRSDDQIRIIHARGEILKDKDGSSIMMLGTGQDVTERMQEEEMEKLSTAATKSFNSVIIANKDGGIEWVNEGFIKLSNYTLEELKTTKKTIYDLICNAKFTKEFIIAESIVNKKPLSFERENYARDGKKYWVITTITPVSGKNGKTERIIAIDSDITLRKQIEEELIKANHIAEHSLMKGNKALDELTRAKKQLEESMKVKEQFLANMSHEIRTPMNAIIGFTTLILKTELSPEQKQFIDAIKTSGENLIVIINDILDFSKIQSGKINFEQIGFKLRNLVSSVADLMLPKSKEKNIRLSYEIEKSIPDDIVGDPTRLNQILINLVGNAIKFSENGEVKIRVDMLEEQEEFVELKFSVSDTGIGIPEDKLTNIFEGFTQATNETTRKYGGTGLGLTIVKQLIESQNGSISVESKVGVGSSFIFNLKFKKSSYHQPNKEIEKVNEAEEPYVEGLKILLVEDNLMNQMLAKKVLSNWHWNVDLAVNGLIAVEKAKENDYDVILMDIQLPEMDGYNATRHIRRDVSSPKCNTPIIAMTAHAIAGEAEKCYAAGMNDYISKPFDEKVLYNKILSACKKNKLSEVKLNK
jgi:PAS domain S-box-containing protein